MSMSQTIFRVLMIGTLLSVAAPSFAASTQDDIATCRAALSEKGEMNMKDYRLHYIKSKGRHKARTLYLKAISYKGAKPVELECHIQKSHDVVALKLMSGATLWAAK